MRLAHKRKVQMKLQKRIKATVANLAAAPKTAKPVAEKAAVKPVVEKAVAEKKVAAAKTVDVALTPKQQQVLDIVVANAEGINPKGIGLAAGQEDAKAASCTSTPASSSSSIRSPKASTAVVSIEPMPSMSSTT